MRTLLLMVAIGAQWAQANTFVGNGGSQGDVELAVTRKQISETMTVIQNLPDTSELCMCNSAFENRAICEPLNQLTDGERAFCSKVLAQQAAVIAGLIGPVPIRWTDAPITVMERGQALAVDAVTDNQKREITVNVGRFLTMNPFERVFLLTHEYAHLTHFEGKPLVDEGPIGAFEGEQGGRRLLNALGAAAAILQAEYPGDIRKYGGSLQRSQSWKPVWLELDFGKARFREKPGTFAAEDFDRSAFLARYNFGDFGVVGGLRTERSDFTALDTVTVEEEKQIYSVGAAYRFFLFKDPLTFWGQSHLQIQALVDFVQSKIKLTEPATPELSDKKSTVGGSLAVRYYLPVLWGFWGYLGVAYESHPYKYSKLNVDYKRNMTSSYIGVAYGF